MRNIYYGLLFIFLLSPLIYSQSYADSGYYYLNLGQVSKAITYFETYTKENPKDSKIRMQLGYIYYDKKQYNRALRNFEYVGRHGNDPKDVENARSAIYVIKDQLAGNSKYFLDIYLHNYYDSYQKNYIGNLVAHYNLKIEKNFYTGLYIDGYTDSRSKAGEVYNDRYVELGGFLRYNLLDNLFFEFRAGYVRQLNTDTSSINIKPLVVFFHRLGNALVYTNKSSSKRTSLYMDMYYAAMYDLKYQNSFLQGAFQEVLRFGTGGYSYVEPYLMQLGQFDSRRLDYNNFLEVGTGIRFKPNLPYFPVFFVEPTYKVYMFGETKNSFQIKAGFQFIYRTKL